MPLLFPQNLTGHDATIGQSPYLGGASQGDSVSAAPPGSQISIQNNTLGHDPLPTFSFDVQDPSHTTAPGPTDSLDLFTDDADLRTPPTEHSRYQASRSEDHELEVIVPFDICDLLQIVQKYVTYVFDVLQQQGLYRDEYHDISYTKRAFEEDMRSLLEQMKGLLEQAHKGGKVDRVRWMVPRLRTAINDPQLLASTERTNLLLKMKELYTIYKDVSGADSVSQDLLLSDCIDASSEPKATAIFVGSMQGSLERGSGTLQKLECILPRFHRLVLLGNPDTFPLLEQEAASGKTPEKDFIGQTILHIAAAKGHDALIKYVLDLRGRFPSFYMNIEERDHVGRTPVCLAISCGQWAAYRILRDRGASLDIRNQASHPPLAMATRGNHGVIMEDLIKEGCSVNGIVLPAMGGCPPLHIAAERGHLGAVQVLLRHGADRTFRRMGDGKTAAELAQSSGHSNLADLIDRGG